MKQSNKEDIVILSTADWDNPFWTNKQHVAMELANRGHRVLYIESLGLRRPSINKKDIRRIFKRVLKGIQPPQKVQDRIWVWSPISIPFNSYKIIRMFNKLILGSLLFLYCRLLSFKQAMLWTYNPLTTHFLSLKKFSYTVYHCVDEIKEQPDMPVSILQTAEEDLTRKSNIVFVTSLALLESRKKWSDEVYYFSNVADFEHFSKALLSEQKIPDDLKQISKPILGFIGAISSYKINFDLLVKLAKSHPEWSLVLIGAVGEGDPYTDVSLLKNENNIHILGPRSYDELPGYLKGFDIALLPNIKNEYTASMFPMKFFEYLAAGKDIVSVDLSSLREFNHYISIGKTDDEFIKAIEKILQCQDTSLEKKLALAQQYTYKTRTEKMFYLIEQKRNL